MNLSDLGALTEIRVDGVPILAKVGPVRHTFYEREELTLAARRICAREEDLDVVDGQEVDLDGEIWLVATAGAGASVSRFDGLVQASFTRYLN